MEIGQIWGSVTLPVAPVTSLEPRAGHRHCHWQGASEGGRADGSEDVLRVDKWSICEVDFAGSRDAGFILELGKLHVYWVRWGEPGEGGLRIECQHGVPSRRRARHHAPELLV